MEYLDEFKEFVNYCNQNGKYVGWETLTLKY